ncbi:hypothetical protein pb186bvf_010448 [Paramecium bursaria]
MLLFDSNISLSFILDKLELYFKIIYQIISLICTIYYNSKTQNKKNYMQNIITKTTLKHLVDISVHLCFALQLGVQYYVYFGLSGCFFIKCYVSLIVVRKSYLQLNMAAFFLQLEIQTLLPVLILLIDFKLNKGEVMIITASSQLLSLSLSVGSKMVLKSLAIIYQCFIQILICFIVGDINPIWISFSIFTMIFHLQWAYFQEKDKRQKFVLHKNAELIESALINQIKIPIFRCRFKKETQQLKFISSNLQAKRSININNQDTFNQFINNAEYDDIRSTSIQVPKLFGQTMCNNSNRQTLGYLIRQFFRKNLNEIYSYANINKNTNNYEFNQKRYKIKRILCNELLLKLVLLQTIVQR